MNKPEPILIIIAGRGEDFNLANRLREAGQRIHEVAAAAAVTLGEPQASPELHECAGQKCCVEADFADAKQTVKRFLDNSQAPGIAGIAPKRPTTATECTCPAHPMITADRLYREIDAQLAHSRRILGGLDKSNERIRYGWECRITALIDFTEHLTSLFRGTPHLS